MNTARSSHLPPGPRSPGLYQLLRFATQPYAFFDLCTARYGDAFTVDMATYGKFVMVASPELIKQVFTADDAVLHAGKANRDLEPLVGPRSLLLLDGAEHLRHRRLLMPPFHGERMRAYAALIWQGVRSAVARMPVGEPFALHPYLQQITLEVILRAVFGLESGPRMDAMTDVLVAFLEPPSPVLMFLPKLDLPLSPYRAFVRRRDAVDREVRALLRERRDAAPREDILSLLLAARDEQGQPLTDDELRDELMTLLLAGHETTATSLAWAFERVLAEPEVGAKLDAELAGAASSPEAVASLTYLDAVVKETLRLRPILPDVVREVQSPWTLGDWTLPAGTRVAPCIYLAHKRAASYPEPDRFLPERFVGAKVDPYAWLPFGGGIRRCLGMAFAMYEMKIVLGGVLAHARLRLASDAVVRPVRRGITIAPAGGTRVVLLERRTPAAS